ncbi:MAG: alkaline shock response membrane anchor protein AmaP [Halanaerobiales bacterium]|nr:alkaline shock response membrane anchor protein AmaP [Halanaerobiales bacterium]
MKFYHRLTLFILTLLFLVITFTIILNGFGWLPENYLSGLVCQTYDNQEVALVSLVLFFIGVWVFQSFITEGQKNKTIIQENALGEIRIAMSAIRDLIHDIVLDQTGVKNVKSKFRTHGDVLNIFLKLTITTDAQISGMSKEIQDLVKDFLLQKVGIRADEVFVTIQEVESAKKSMNSTVRVR